MSLVTVGTVGTKFPSHEATFLEVQRFVPKSMIKSIMFALAKTHISHSIKKHSLRRVRSRARERERVMGRSTHIKNIVVF